MAGTFRMFVKPPIPGRCPSLHWFSVKCHPDERLKCADALNQILCGTLKGIACCLNDPAYDGVDLYVAKFGNWVPAIAAFGPEKLAAELYQLGFEREAA